MEPFATKRISSWTRESTSLNNSLKINLLLSTCGSTHVMPKIAIDVLASGIFLGLNPQTSFIKTLTLAPPDWLTPPFSTTFQTSCKPASPVSGSSGAGTLQKNTKQTCEPTTAWLPESTMRLAASSKHSMIPVSQTIQLSCIPQIMDITWRIEVSLANGLTSRNLFKCL